MTKQRHKDLVWERQHIRTSVWNGGLSPGEGIVALMQLGYLQEQAERFVAGWKKQGTLGGKYIL